MPTKSYLSQSELPLTFGLGTSEQIDEIVIRWPSGKEQRLTAVRPDQVLTVREPE
jgi:hypothetical protein